MLIRLLVNTSTRALVYLLLVNPSTLQLLLSQTFSSYVPINIVPYVAHAIYGTFLVVKKIFMNGQLTIFAAIPQLVLG